ncbi:hypothetical protein N0V87_003027 [Didymella glomerata]|uniref:Uncharacterized protein n=1 Tax=Didymella glomerata TaxID=749621 RepID=A0A9W8X3P5_9PLEO|nr:hypothetical protein N0V87_003027 [Didymella glomerata]
MAQTIDSSPVSRRIKVPVLPQGPNLVPTHEEVARIEEGIGILQVDDWLAVPNNPTKAQQLELLDFYLEDAHLLDKIARFNRNRDSRRVAGQELQADAEARAANLAGQAEAARAGGRTAAARAEIRALGDDLDGYLAFNKRYRLM